MVSPNQTNGHSGGGYVPSSQSPYGDTRPYGVSQIGVHDLVPQLGYREYWYPAVEIDKLNRRSHILFGRRKPVHVRMLGEDVVLFKGKEGKIGALWDRCPHRGAYLSLGRCEFEGTVSCPYHGYTFDHEGVCLAALTEGPDSGLTGKLTAHAYPTAVVQGVAFVWMGKTEAVPIEEDVPEELIDGKHSINTYSKVWPINWSLTLENSGDSHNSYIHRFRFRRILNLTAFRQLPAYWSGTRVVGETDKSMGINPTAHAPQQAYFPGLGKKWPQHVWFRFLRARRRGQVKENFTGKPYSNEYRLPSIARVDAGGSSGNLHMRWATPIDKDHSNMFTFSIRRGVNWWDKWYGRLYFHFVYKMQTIKTTNELEDLPVQRYDHLDPTAPQKLGVNDRAIIHWRRKMPLKSRDAQRVWGEMEKAAVEADAIIAVAESMETQEAETIALASDD